MQQPWHKSNSPTRLPFVNVKKCVRRDETEYWESQLEIDYRGSWRSASLTFSNLTYETLELLNFLWVASAENPARCGCAREFCANCGCEKGVVERGPTLKNQSRAREISLYTLWSRKVLRCFNADSHTCDWPRFHHNGLATDLPEKWAQLSSKHSTDFLEFSTFSVHS